jgi:hypothetical protein
MLVASSALVAHAQGARRRQRPRPQQQYPQQQYPQQQAPGAQPGSMGPAPSPALDSGAPPEPAVADEKPKLVIVVPRAGLLAASSAEIELEVDCNAAAEQLFGAESCSSASEDFNESVAFGVGADLLFSLSRNVRLGIGAGYRFTFDGEFDVPGADEVEGGSLLSLHGVGDFAIPASPQIDVVLRVAVGPSFLFEGGDLEDSNEEQRDFCNTQSGTCEVGGSPHVGLLIGIGGGVAIRTGSVRLRPELMYERGMHSLSSVEQSESGLEITQSQSLTSNRLWLTFGVEL